ncbi:Ribosomal protein L16 Arg81 hydroxylase, contains JmjC domain [Arboricoccus pini]|uniref:Ribosomal protein L16 Arg81 hydroxylase, contains JmjC domain n=1 Tax=Arboricoccus pini TaxID=1963835 RepID=A0A212RT38_9PROT|nr:cupin domain-containing protein [Arboricoccus pini]SNB75860.1 Ribosomal protein L16 Arg81 hydroxylase, contains JmjC domain [Arboricoccus pini]
MDFETLLSPIGADAFKRDYLGKKPLHLQGAADKFAKIMNWEVLNRLLGMTTIWSAASLPMVLDKEAIPPTQTSSMAVGRDGGQVLRPDPAKVKKFLKAGATLVANDIDQLTPELSALSRAMEETLGGKVQGNLYLSSKRKQAFRVHYDTHDVFAVHVMGEKTWMVFEGKAENPIAHQVFKSQTAEHHEKAKGALWKEVRLKPGDLLYLPRGQYHYALADDGACAHVAMGVTYPIGIDVFSYLFERVVLEPMGRMNLPQGDKAALGAWLTEFGQRLQALATDEQTRADIERFMASYRYPRDTYDLPALIEGSVETFVVQSEGMRLIEQQGRFGLVRAGTREAVEVPAGIVKPLRWTLERQRFTRPEIETAFPDDHVALGRFLSDMMAMKLIRPLDS